MLTLRPLTAAWADKRGAMMTMQTVRYRFGRTNAVDHLLGMFGVRSRITTVVAVLLLAVSLAEAQLSTAIPRIGLLADGTSWEPLRRGLRDLGYVEGKSITLEERSSQGRNERFPDLASELVRLKVNIIVTSGTPATLAATQATTTIPIVMAGAGDPVKSGFVSSLAQPGGNVTGLTVFGPGLAAKRLEWSSNELPSGASNSALQRTWTRVARPGR